MTDRNEPWLQAPCKENGNEWRVYGMGVVWDHSQEWQAKWKLHCLEMAARTLKSNVTRPDSGLSE